MGVLQHVLFSCKNKAVQLQLYGKSYFLLFVVIEPIRKISYDKADK